MILNLTTANIVSGFSKQYSHYQYALLVNMNHQLCKTLDACLKSCIPIALETGASRSNLQFPFQPYHLWLQGSEASLEITVLLIHDTLQPATPRLTFELYHRHKNLQEVWLQMLLESHLKDDKQISGSAADAFPNNHRLNL